MFQPDGSASLSLPSLKEGIGRKGNLSSQFRSLGVVNAGYAPASVPIFARRLIGRELRGAKLLVGDEVVSVHGGLVWAQMPPLTAGSFQLL